MKYARKCSVTGKGMNQGFIFNEGQAYACDEDSARKYLVSIGEDPDEEFRQLNEAFSNDDPDAPQDYWFYWTEWGEDDIWEDGYFTEDGQLVDTDPVTHWVNKLGNLYPAIRQAVVSHFYAEPPMDSEFIDRIMRSFMEDVHKEYHKRLFANEGQPEVHPIEALVNSPDWEYDEGDGVEYEIYTNGDRRIRIPIEVVRLWEDWEELDD